ncbi:MAG: hypothetical protein D3923_19540 [Candidatus Electrothrix sp. AR3]|nr:hypothetical protein [Candidatus Electrothrix sp. AR3]
MNVTLSLQHDEMAEEDIQEMAFALRQSIQQETDLGAELPKTTGGTGTRGDAITTGQIILTLLSSGTIVAFLQVLQAYIERKPTLRFEIEKADGSKMKIEAEHLTPAQIDQTIQQLLNDRDA